MSKPQSTSVTAGDVATSGGIPFTQTTIGRLMLVVLATAAWTVSFAPVGQFYFAWVALVPWLVLIAEAPTKKAVFWWSWLTGTAVFSANMWWLIGVTIPGTIALMFYLGFWFVIAGLIVRSAGVLRMGARLSIGKALLMLVLVPMIWLGVEWARGVFLTGLPWLFIGHSQTPVLAMCQIADFAGVFGVGFWVVMINTLIAGLLLKQFTITSAAVNVALTLAVVLGVWFYGRFRMNEDMAYPGPVVMVIQPAYPQDNSGDKGATMPDILDFHMTTTLAGLAEQKAKGSWPDVVVWSETMMPTLNEEYRTHARGKGNQYIADIGAYLDGFHNTLNDLAREKNIRLLAGGIAMIPDRGAGSKAAWARKNSVYLYGGYGDDAGKRYDKIHLVPFGEFTPFRESAPLIHQFLNLFNPYKEDYTVVPGKEIAVFSRGAMPGLSHPPGNWKFVTPICFEDVDSELVASMIRGDGDKRPGANFIVNMTNDGWFAGPQMAQHLQLATFRSIENRAPTARSVNMGISGFIDSVGRTQGLIGKGKAGHSTMELKLDKRCGTVFSAIGDLFGKLCAGVAGLVVLWGYCRRLMKRGATGR